MTHGPCEAHPSASRCESSVVMRTIPLGKDIETSMRRIPMSPSIRPRKQRGQPPISAAVSSGSAWMLPSRLDISEGFSEQRFEIVQCIASNRSRCTPDRGNKRRGQRATRGRRDLIREHSVGENARPLAVNYSTVTEIDCSFESVSGMQRVSLP